MDLDWHLMPISEEATSSQPPPSRPNHIADTRPRKKKARTLRETDWEPYKNRIIQLHLVEKRSLPEVKILIEQEFGFTAEIRQYRSRLSQWKLDKNIKPDEMKAIVRHHQQRNIVETDKNCLKFRVRGQEVELHKIERWMKRHDVMDSMLYAPSPDATTPSAVSYATMSEIGSPGTCSMLSPGVMDDIDLTIDHASTTPRQIISSLPNTPHKRTDMVLEAPSWNTTDLLHGLHVVQVDEEHFFARWRYESRITMHTAERNLSHLAWLRNVLSELTYGLMPEREAIVLCRYIIHVSLYDYYAYSSPRGSVSSEEVDLIIYICHNPHTQTVGIKFIAEGTQAQNLQNLAMGFELVTGGGVRTCRFAQFQDWMIIDDPFNEQLGWYLVLVDESRLQPFTWPSNDGDVQRAQFFTSRFG